MPKCVLEQSVTYTSAALFLQNHFKHQSKQKTLKPVEAARGLSNPPHARDMSSVNDSIHDGLLVINLMYDINN